MSKYLLKGITSLENIVVFGTSSLLIILITFSVLSRYLFSYGVPWIIEVTKILYIWLCFFAISWSMRRGRGGLISVEMLDMFLDKRKALVITIFKNIVAGIFYIIIICSTFVVIKLAYDKSDATPYLQIPNWIVNSGVLLGFIFTTIRTYFQVLDNIQEYKILKTGKDN